VVPQLTNKHKCDKLLSNQGKTNMPPVDALKNLSTPERRTERLDPATIELFDQASEFIDSLQTSESFVETAQKFHVELDETSARYNAPDYWNAVRFVALQEIEKGNYVGDPSLLNAMRITASAPSFIHSLTQIESPGINKRVKERLKLEISSFNGYLRDFVADNLDTPIESFSELLSDVASEGIDKNMITAASESIRVSLAGVRTEVGFEQKATRANLHWERGTAAQDLKGIDYVVEGIPVDIKSSLEGVFKNKSDSVIDKAYRIGFGGHVTLYPYDRVDTDYPDNTFRVTEDNLEQKSFQLARDFYIIKQELA